MLTYLVAADSHWVVIPPSVLIQWAWKFALLILVALTVHLLQQHDLPKKNQGVFVKHYAPGGNKVQKAIFSFKVKVKVTRSFTLVSFERASLVEYVCQIWSLYLLLFKSFSEG